MMYVRVWLLVCLAAGLDAAVLSDRVLNLPGLSWKPTFKHYSGYLKATGTRHLHYWFLESAGNPKTDPVVLWMNGGPGCSSMDGLLSEHGPFIAASNGGLKKNPFSWNKVANMLYLEAPAGVGYSYATDKNYTTGDDQVSIDNFAALKDFFSKYPEFRSNDFYITGESYAGIYVPTLSVRVSQDNTFNFKGLAIGNGISNYVTNTNSQIYFSYYHGLFGEKIWTRLMTNCCDGGRTDQCNFVVSNNTECKQAVGEVENILNNDINIYNLYQECYHPPSLEGAEDVTYINPVSFLFPPGLGDKRTVNSKSSGKLKMSPPCVNATAISDYLNSPDVRTALHIPSDLPEWEICNGVIGMEYRREYLTMKNQYLELLSTAKYRILVYNGDIDMACNFLGDQWFVDSLKQKLVKDWAPWYYTTKSGKQIAGFIKQFKNISFVTIKGAGHMVPTDKPVPAFKMFSSFLQAKL